MAERDNFLKETEHLGENDPLVRTVVDALYVRYVEQNTLLLYSSQNDHDTYMRILGAIRALEELLKKWHRFDLLRKLSKLRDVDYTSKLYASNPHRSL